MTPKAGDADFGTPTNPGRPREMSTHLGTQVVANPPDLRMLTQDGLFTNPTTDVTDRDARYKQGGTPLSAQARAIGRMPFGTPTAGVGEKDAAPTEGMARRYLVDGKGGNLLETVAGVMWPTPRAGKTTEESEESWRRRNQEGGVSTPPLSLAVKMWATPRGEGHDAGHHPGRSDSLDAQVRDVVVGPLYPTPDASGEKFRLSGDSQQSRCLEARARPGELDGVPQKLNPDFVERLMGLPDAWTVLDGEAKAPLPPGCDDPLSLFMVNREYEVPLTVGGKTPDRVSRLKALGNAVVPQIPFLIFAAIEAADQ